MSDETLFLPGEPARLPRIIGALTSPYRKLPNTLITLHNSSGPLNEVFVHLIPKTSTTAKKRANEMRKTKRQDDTRQNINKPDPINVVAIVTGNVSNNTTPQPTRQLVVLSLHFLVWAPRQRRCETGVTTRKEGGEASSFIDCLKAFDHQPPISFFGTKHGGGGVRVPGTPTVTGSLH